MKKLLSYIFTLLAAVAVAACSDDFAPEGSGSVPEGRGSLSLQAVFSPMAESLTEPDESRAATGGKELSGVESLVVILYDRNGRNPRVLDRNDFVDQQITISDEDRTNADAANGISAEASTKKAQFSIRELEFGYYQAYVVANMGNRTQFMADYGNMIETPADLRAIKLKWNSSEVTRNSQMLGVVTDASAKENVPALGDPFTAPTIRFGQDGQKFHAWLRRAASKVTITMDGSGLRENITIYFRRATIHDIPSTCLLGERNTPTAESVTTEPLIATGSDSYDIGSGSNFNAWPSVSKGNPTLDEAKWNHSETAPALFFYENAQRDYTFDADRALYDKRQEPARGENGELLDQVKDKTDLKDKVHYGSYIEVEGYYVSRTFDQTSNGKIIYRFMLGQDEKFNYEAFRNCHYKLTMRFRGNANDVDWHIEYNEDFPQLYAPEKYYISYLYDRTMSMPLKVNTGKAYELMKLDAEIISNNWAPEWDNSPHYYDPTGTTAYQFTYNKSWYLSQSKPATELYPYSDNEVVNSLDPTRYNTDPWFGFLSLRRTRDKIVGGDTHNPDDLKDYYYNPAAPRGTRTYYDLSKGGITGSNASDGEFEISAKNDSSVTFQLPFYTRAKQMSTFLVYSGNNPYPYPRTAVVRFTATFRDKTDHSKTIIRHRRVVIQQARRIENPKGIWRAWNNSDPFEVKLTHYDPASGRFTPLKSEGPWRAEIAVGSDWVRLNGGNRTVNGSTGSEIAFKYQPNGSAANANTVRSGVIRIYYHNYTCVHLIFLRQGYADQEIVQDGTVIDRYYADGSTATKSWKARKWSVYNLFTGKAFTKSPLGAGSYFKLGNLTQPIAESNNTSFKLGMEVNTSKVTIQGGTATAYNTVLAKYQRNSLPAAGTDLWGNISINNLTYNVATHEDYDLLMNNCEEGYGVLYADGATTVATTSDQAFGYTGNAASSNKGMRGIFLYNANSSAPSYYGRNIFFPISASGHGRRQSVLNAGGQLRYGDVAYTIGPNVNNNARVMIYDLLQTPGAMYWYGKRKPNGFLEGSTLFDSFSQDINYYMFGFTHYHIRNVNYSNKLSDALLLRVVR